MGLFKVQESAPAPRGGRVASRVVPDSPLEGDGFEPSVPRPRRALLSGPYRSLLRRAGGGEVGTAVQPDFFCSATHSIEPRAYTVLVGCGLSRCSVSRAGCDHCRALLGDHDRRGVGVRRADAGITEVSTTLARIHGRRPTPMCGPRAPWRGRRLCGELGSPSAAPRRWSGPLPFSVAAGRSFTGTELASSCV
jgi:hypothetical protein